MVRYTNCPDYKILIYAEKGDSGGLMLRFRLQTLRVYVRNPIPPKNYLVSRPGAHSIRLSQISPRGAEVWRRVCCSRSPPHGSKLRGQFQNIPCVACKLGVN
ncbi:hypothetical protein AVEN_43741-1 [Araneus ventricosus]|uniref:Uncharacterized protein n=1 Tax=Araneus ventricosus TaxID=182803 RepID=A0A4Y2BW63_ARAVE|nr:hypothetical protein AVEN_43741-1 [Araneus ventricosus]